MKNHLALVLLGGIVACSDRGAPDVPAGGATSEAVDAHGHEALISTHPVASNCVVDNEVSAYMGRYSVTAIKRYGGGLTSKAQAMQYMGKAMITLTMNRVIVMGNESIANPKYSTVCQPNPQEGEVTPPDKRYSYFYGFGRDREVASVLQVRDSTGREPTPYYEFELRESHGKRELWYLSDGWLYELEMIQ